MQRRDFIAASLAMLAPLPLLSAENDGPAMSWPVDLRWLWLKREVNGKMEESKIAYFKDGSYQRDGYIAACNALRDTREESSKQVVQIDFILLDLVFACQEWLRLNHIVKPVHVLSGYRSQRSNSRLEGAAKNSMHMYGKAIDIFIPGLPTEYIVKLGAWFQAGGTGWYSKSGFVHLDTGNIRHWRK